MKVKEETFYEICELLPGEAFITYLNQIHLMSQFSIIKGPDGEAYIKATDVIDLMKEACQTQRELCAEVGKHHKFGWYKYKKADMINAAEPRIDITYQK